MKTTTLIILVAISMLQACSKNTMSVFIEDNQKGFNGSFEEVTDFIPVNWQIYTQETAQNGTFKVMLDTTQSADGANSLKFDVQSCSEVGGWQSPGIAKEIEGKPLKNYLISFYVKNQASKFKVKIGGVTATEAVYQTIIETNETFEDWKKIEFQFAMPENMHRLRFELNVLSKGTLWVDQIKMEEI